jgi:NADH dehydrogenase (ubiquinone) Fe-S protein 1
MMRQQLLRTLRRSQRPAAQANAVRNLSSSARRAAEVELTIDGKKVSIEGMPPLENTWKL